MSKLLRKLTVLLAAFSLMFFVGCSDSDNGSNNADTTPDYSALPIIGTWEMEFEQGGNDFLIEVTFNANGTAREVQYVYVGGQFVQGQVQNLRWTGTQNSFTITSGTFFIHGTNTFPYYIDEYDGETWLVVLGGQFELVKVQ